MSAKKDPLKGFNNERLIQEVIDRRQADANEFRGEAEAAMAEADEIEDTISQLKDVYLGES